MPAQGTLMCVLTCFSLPDQHTFGGTLDLSIGCTHFILMCPTHRGVGVPLEKKITLIAAKLKKNEVSIGGKRVAFNFSSFLLLFLVWKAVLPCWKDALCGSPCLVFSSLQGALVHWNHEQGWAAFGMDALWDRPSRQGKLRMLALVPWKCSSWPKPSWPISFQLNAAEGQLRWNEGLPVME